MHTRTLTLLSNGILCGTFFCLDHHVLMFLTSIDVRPPWACFFFLVPGPIFLPPRSILSSSVHPSASLSVLESSFASPHEPADLTTSTMACTNLTSHHFSRPLLFQRNNRVGSARDIRNVESKFQLTHRIRQVSAEAPTLWLKPAMQILWSIGKE